MNADDRALFAGLTAEIRGLRADVNRLLERMQPASAPRQAGSENDLGLAAAVVAAAGEAAFTAAEMIEHSLVIPDLRAALENAGAISARRLGKALRRLERLDLGGYVIERIGSDRDGALWRVFASVSLETRKLANPVASEVPDHVSRNQQSSRRRLSR